MKTHIGVVITGLVLLFASAAGASIVTWNCDDDGDGAIVMDTTALNPNGEEYILDMACAQYDYPGHIEGDFQTDTELDPIVWLIQSVENETTFAWTDYHITIGMTKNFSILTTGIIAPADWTWSISQPVSGQTMPNGGTGWVGTIDYYMSSGAPVNIGEYGDFGFKVSFLGSVEFCTEQIPTPEPATMALLSLGGLALLRRKK